MCAYGGLFVRSALYLRAGDAIRGRGGEAISRLFRLGLVAGVLELIVDWWLVHGVANGRLDYLGAPDVVLLASPVWMPLAWACVIVELGYPALRLFSILRSRVPAAGAAALASIMTGIGAGVTVGFYEYFAYRAGWWKYAPAHVMIGRFCAAFIPVGETFMFLAILPIARRAIGREDDRTAAAVEGGATFAVTIFAGYALAYLLLEAGRLP